MRVTGFNPHTHEGCDPNYGCVTFAINVSIHTPTKGVTAICNWVLAALSVSIHTPTKGVTFLSKFITIPFRFQSTHPRRVWHKRNNFDVSMLSFNPHTHEGCDLILKFFIAYILSFNPHTHEGCDSLYASWSSPDSLFQSTHPRRVWRISANTR